MSHSDRLASTLGRAAEKWKLVIVSEIWGWDMRTLFPPSRPYSPTSVAGGEFQKWYQTKRRGCSLRATRRSSTFTGLQLRASESGLICEIAAYERWFRSNTDYETLQDKVGTRHYITSIHIQPLPTKQLYHSPVQLLQQLFWWHFHWWCLMGGQHYHLWCDKQRAGWGCSLLGPMRWAEQSHQNPELLGAMHKRQTEVCIEPTDAMQRNDLYGG